MKLSIALPLALALPLVSSHTIWGADFDHDGNQLSSSTCTDNDFPDDYAGKQVSGLQSNPSATNAASCQAACCAAGATSCQVYQWIPKKTAADSLVPGCWMGKMGAVIGSGADIISRGRPSPPPPSGPYLIDDTQGLGMRWEGVGAISGGGATSKLLMDYDSDVVSDILDFMFKPNFGLDLDILKGACQLQLRPLLLICSCSHCFSAFLSFLFIAFYF